MFKSFEGGGEETKRGKGTEQEDERKKQRREEKRRADGANSFVQDKGNEKTIKTALIKETYLRGTGLTTRLYSKNDG